MQRQKRRHHYLPRYYLGGFTEGGSQKDPLVVRSKKLDRTWTTRAESAGHKRDLFRPEGEQFGPDEFEDGFGSVEGAIAPVLKAAIRTEVMPDEEGLGLLVHLVALNAARPPAEMARLADLVDENLRRLIVEEMTEEAHQRVLEEWRAEGRSTEHVEDLDALKRRIAAGRVRATISRDYMLVMGVLGRAAGLVDLLGRRSWTLLVAGVEDLRFASCDRPVNLLNNRNIPAVTPGRYDDPRFDVIMPLSKRLCLVGRPDGRGGTAVASELTVQFINHITVAGADDFVYAASEEYVVSSASDIPPDAGEAYRHDLAKMVHP